MNQKKMNRRLARTVEMLTSLSHLDVPVYAGNAVYFITLAVFPTVMLLLNLLSYTTLGTEALLSILETVIPDALMPSATRLLNSMFESSSGTLVSVSALTALWAASRGVYSILVGLNRIYGVHEDRSIFYTRFLSLVYTFLFLVVLVLSLALHVFGQTILATLPSSDNRALKLLVEVLSNRYLVLLALQTALFTAMFMFLPNRRNKLLPSVPGALFASLGWLLFSQFFSIYVNHFSNYATVYGSLSTMAIAMLWLYTCMAIVFYGGALNKYLMDIGYQLRVGQKQGQNFEEN